MLKYSLIKRKKPNNKMAITIIISIFIYICYLKTSKMDAQYFLLLG
jgi:hypothetical protein